MPRRRKLDLEAIRERSKLECPHCHERTDHAACLRVDYERLRCGKCGKDFLPQAKGRFGRQSEGSSGSSIFSTVNE
jgi:DNA-directed RNA polymerase subunit RPC12/RpoP